VPISCSEIFAFDNATFLDIKDIELVNAKEMILKNFKTKNSDFTFSFYTRLKI